MSQGQVPSPGSPHQHWRGAAPAGEGGQVQRPGRAKKVVGPVALLLALAAAVVAFLLFPRGMTNPYFLTLAIREYKSPLLPINGFAVQDGDLLIRRFAEGKAEKFYHIQTESDIRKVFQELSHQKERPVVVHLCALARWADGEVYVLGGDADPDQKDAGVRLSDLLRLLRDCPAPEKLLILDIMRPIAGVRLGLLTDDIAEHAHAVLAKEKDLPFSVLCACSPGQLSQVSEELGQSTFAYYLDQGLRGHADGYGPHGHKDQRIKVMELAEFVTRRVDRWAWHNRAVRQTPVLVGQGTDFPLVRLEPDALDELPCPAADASFPKWLKDAWAERGKWHKELHRFGPGVLRHVDAVLLQAERGWRGGIEESRLKDELETKLQRFKEQVDRIAMSRRPVPARSLALALDQMGPGPSFEDMLRRLLPKALDPSLPLNDERKKKKEELDKETQQALIAIGKHPLEGAQAVVVALASLPKLAPAHLYLAQQLLEKLELTNPFAETILVERLQAFAKHVLKEDEDWPEPAARQALRTLREAEEVVKMLALEPGLLPWVDKELQAAEGRRRAGEKLLFAGQLEDWPKALAPLREAEKLHKAAQARLRNLQEARELWDWASELLPAVTPAFSAEGKGDEKAINAAVAQAVKLADVLAQRDRDPEGLALVRQSLADLQRSFEAQAKRTLAVRNDAGAEDYRALQAFLESPWPPGPLREQFWQARRKLGLRLFEHSQELDEADDRAEQRQPLKLPGQESAREHERRKWRARQSLAMIRLAGSAEMGKLDQLLQKAENQTNDGPWREIAEKLSQAWPAPQLKEFTFREPAWTKVERLSRFLSPFDVNMVRSTEPSHWSQNPTLAVYRTDLARLGRWLSERYREASTGLEPGTRFHSFYSGAAEDYRQFADKMK